MKGTTHAAVGTAIGSAVALVMHMSFAEGAICAVTGALSALCPDLDGQGLLANKLSKTSKAIHRMIIGLGLMFALWGAYQYFIMDVFKWGTMTSAIIFFVLSGVLKVGLIRNLMLSFIGVLLILTGGLSGRFWLAGLGCFIACAPWFKHRGFTHTIWCTMGWTAIGWGLEQETGISGLTIAAGSGYLSHLVLDTMTPSGIKWLYPLYNKTFRFR